MHQREEVILKVENVSLTYDRPILRDVNFEIHNITRPGISQGQVVSLVGRSGIGKTQLFKILSGLLKPNAGTVLIDTTLRPVKPGDMGIVPQNYILFNHRTVFKNLLIGLEGSGSRLNTKEKAARIESYAEKFGLAEHLKKFPMQLSGGQRQRVSILQQIMNDSRFLLLDEPFSGLDPLVKDKVLELLVEVSLLHDHNTLVLVSHDLENSLAISDTVFILANQAGMEGATITETIDLIDMGFAWKPDIKSDRRFQEMVAEMKNKI